MSILIIMAFLPWNYRLAAQHTDDISQQEMQQARDNIRQKLILDNKEFREEAEKYARLDDLDFLLIDSATVEGDWLVYYFYPVSDSKFKQIEEKEEAYISAMRSYYINNPNELYEYIAAEYGFCSINKRCPIRIDTDTHLDSTGISDQHFIYYFSTSTPTSPTDVDIMRYDIRTNLENGDPSVKQLVSLCIATNKGYCHRYYYRDSKSKSGKKAKMKTEKEVLDICFSIEELKEIRNHQNLWSR